MKLEDEIRQSSFSSEHHKLILNLLYTTRWIDNTIKVILAKNKITEPQYNILRILKGAHPNPVSPQEIKEVMLNKKTDLTRMLDRLISKDLISREVNPENRRKVDLTISACGIGLLSVVNPEICLATEAVISKNISEEEAITASLLIDKLRG